MKVVDSLVVVMLVRDVVVLAVMMVTSRLDRPPPIVLHDAIVRGDCLDVSVSIDSEEAAMCVADGDLPLLVVVLCITERDEKKGSATEGDDWTDIGLDWTGSRENQRTDLEVRVSVRLGMESNSAMGVAGELVRVVGADEPVIAVLLERPLVVLVSIGASVNSIAVGREEAVLVVESVLSGARHLGGCVGRGGCEEGVA